ncbi:MAG TPA: metal-dependent hydrolase [Flavisolibacter sp.]|jgi:L-ascorbate metabolism protein UlaG (beta-lactamase superfamily)|nr:metal-dependent hydrolase [Flavisolibacter sp.]
MKFTYYGQSCFALDLPEHRLIFDPFITPNELARHIDISSLKADFILISHGHSDHIADCVTLARQTGATVIGAFEVTNWLQAQGIEKVHPMNIGGKWSFEFGTVKCLNAVHSSAMPDGSYGGNPMGFLLNTGNSSIYYSGDTALTMDMQLVSRWGKVTVGILPIGDNFTMGYEDAIMAAELIQCKTIIGVHFDTFGYIKIDHKKVKEAFSEAGLNLILPSIGETVDL